MRRKRSIKKKYRRRKETLVFGLGLIPKEGVPEIKIRYNRSNNKFLGMIGNSKDVADFVRKIYGRGNIQLQESFIVLYLNDAHEILGYYKHATGGISRVTTDVRLIFAAALASASTFIAIAHNHPSGNVKPSETDIEYTKTIKQAGLLLHIVLLDHLIVSKDSYFSFADEYIL